MRVIIYLADGFEDVEAFAPIDIFRRAGIQVDMCSCQNVDLSVTSSHKINTLGSIGYLKPDGYDAAILPGGSLGVKNLFDVNNLLEDLKEYYLNGGVVCAICAAPMILGSLGILKGKRYTCYAGCNEGIDGRYTAKEVEVDGNIITARSMLYSIDFALAIVEKLLGKARREQIYKQIEGLDRK